MENEILGKFITNSNEYSISINEKVILGEIDSDIVKGKFLFIK
jgi:hypothetical protein